jgi:D-alanyl-D-alanine carboxypeptidase/D-alanyl-D-alanine-endopeptidase (penicillin-binding protein 4)
MLAGNAAAPAESMARRLRALLLPVALVVVVVASVAGVVADTASSPARSSPSPATPVLSARRAPGLLTRPAADAALLEDLAGLLNDAPAATCLVVEVGDRRLVEHEPREPLIPASAMKLVVATAVLTRIGPDETFVTKVTGPPPVGGVVEGDLHLVGGGDPLLATAPYAESFTRQPQVFTSLEALVDQIVAAGVERVEGRVVGDETRYDTVRYVRSWRPVYIEDHETGPMSALTVNDGFSSFEPTKVPAPAPAVHAATVLADQLEARGVEVTSPPASGPAPDGATLAEIASPPVREIVGQLLRESDNQTGEMLVKELGWRYGGGGSTREGIAVARDTIAELGLPSAGLEVIDGSGLDRANRLTCELLVAVLSGGGAAEAVTEGLAVVGESGTLGARLRGTPAAGNVVAKTGSLNGVAALVGVATTADGGEARFAFVTNGIGSQAEGNELADRLMLSLSRYPSVRPGRPSPVERSA